MYLSGHDGFPSLSKALTELVCTVLLSMIFCSTLFFPIRLPTMTNRPPFPPKHPKSASLIHLVISRTRASLRHISSSSRSSTTM